MFPTIVPTYAAVLVLIFVLLSVRVIQMRASAKIGLGHGNNPVMERRIRVHGNFADTYRWRYCSCCAWNCSHNPAF